MTAASEPRCSICVSSDTNPIAGRGLKGLCEVGVECARSSRWVVYDQAVLGGRLGEKVAPLVCTSKTGYTIGVNQPLKAIARNGRLIMDVPTDLPDGKEVEVVIVSDEINFAEPWMDEAEAKEFRQEVCASMADHEAGRVIEGAELIAELRARHAL